MECEYIYFFVSTKSNISFTKVAPKRNSIAYFLAKMYNMGLKSGIKLYTTFIIIFLKIQI